MLLKLLEIQRGLSELGYITSKEKQKYVKEYVFYLIFCGCYSYICLKLFCSNNQLVMIKEKDKGVKINDDVRSNTVMANIIKF